MALSGVITGSKSKSFKLKIEWSATQSISGNYSTITEKLYAYKYFNSRAYNNNNNSAYYELNGLKTYSKYDFNSTKGWYYIGSRTFTVHHNADGGLTTSLSGHWHTNVSNSKYTPNDIYVSGNITLNTIPRASSLELSSSSVTMGNSINISINRASSSFTHKLTYEFGSTTGTIGTGIGTSKCWSVPLTLANQIPSSTSGVGTIYCYTYSGGTHIGTSSVNFTAVVPSNIVPSFNSLTLQRVDGTVPHDWGIYVKNKSSCVATVNGATGSYGSSISSYLITGGGYSSTSNTLTTGILNNSGTITFTAKITDSRGRTATKTQSITVVYYSVPNIEQVQTQRCLEDGTINNDGTYVKCNSTIHYSTCNNKNTLTKRISFRKNGEENWSSKIPLTDGVIIGSNGIDANYSYDVKYEVSDIFTTVTHIDSISTSYITMDFKKGGKGIAIGKVSEKDCFECVMDAEFTKGLYVNGGASQFNPQYVPNGTDLNILTKIGDYYQHRTANCNNMTNLPSKKPFHLEVRKIGDMTYQIFKKHLGGITYIRYYYPWSGWTDWICICGGSNPQPLPLVNGCVNFGGSYEVAKFIKSSGFVKLAGLIKPPSNVWSTIATLPQGTIPNKTLIFRVACAVGYADLYIHTDGHIDLTNWTGNPSGWTSLDNIMFYVGY